MLTFAPVTQTDVEQFARWRYEPPYNVYNENPSEPLEADYLAYFLDPENNLYSIFDQAGELVAYCSFGRDGQVPGGDYSADALDLGLGMRPDLTGQGRGIEFVRAMIDFALEKFRPVALRVTIAKFNHRAQRVWQKAGFQQLSQFDRPSNGMPFLIFVHEDITFNDLTKRFSQS